MDWTGCELVERVPGRCSGAPTIVGTRIFPDTIVNYYDSGAGMAEILQDYPSLTEEIVRGLLDFAKKRRSTAA